MGKIKSLENFLGFAPDRISSGRDMNGLQLLRHMLTAFDHISSEDFYILDLKHSEIIYLSRNLTDFLNLRGQVTLDMLIEQSHGQMFHTDNKKYKNLLSFIPKIYKKLEIPERWSLVVSRNYYIGKGIEQTLVFERATPLLIDVEGRLRLLLYTLSASSALEPGNILVTKGYGMDTMYYSLEDGNWHDLIEERLTEQELVVLKLLSRGYTNIQMADFLSKSVASIRKYRRNILKKTGTKNLSQAIKKVSNLRMM